MRHPIQIVLLLIGIAFSNNFEIGGIFCFSDNYERDLYRGQLNIDNTWLSTEMLYESGEVDEREIILYKFGEKSSSSKSGLPLRENNLKKALKKKKFDGYMVEWTSGENTDFFFIHENKGNKGDKNQIFDAWYDDEIEIYGIAQFDFDSKLPITESSSEWGGGNLGISEIKDYLTIESKDEDGEISDALFITYIDGSLRKNIISNDYNMTNKQIYPPKNTNPNPLKNPEEIDIIIRQKRGKGVPDPSDYDAVVTFKGDYEQDIHYFCSIDRNKGIDNPLYPSYAIYPAECKSENEEFVPCRKQIEPKFSFDGGYVAFLNQKSMNQEQKKNVGKSGNNKFDLWAFNTQNIDQFCYEQEDYQRETQYINIPEDGCNYDNTESDYILIDTDIMSIYESHVPLFETRMDYAWHPTQNTIFYIKIIENEKKKTLIYEIKSFNLDDGECSTLLHTKNSIESISISDDGSHIVFSFLKLENIESFMNCSSDAGCCDNASHYKIAVAELIEK